VLKTERQLFKVPGKVFILGEYAVLSGLPAVVATVSPCFTMALGVSDGQQFAPQSPAGRLLAYAREQGAPELQFSFNDPYNGAGGFGASTAQFALLYRAYAEVLGWPCDWFSVWSLYRRLSSVGVAGALPSGADLIAQWQGGVIHYDGAICEDVSSLFDWSSVLVFSATAQAGRKVATHEHLAGLTAERVRKIGADLEPVLKNGIAAIRAGDVRGLGGAVRSYAEVLASHGCELSAAREDRLAISTLPGVVAVKGCGALLADTVLVLLESELVDPAPILKEAAARGLNLSFGPKCVLK
jgi:mevalonate kinase